MKKVEIRTAWRESHAREPNPTSDTTADEAIGTASKVFGGLAAVIGMLVIARARGAFGTDASGRVADRARLAANAKAAKERWMNMIRYAIHRFWETKRLRS